MTESVDQVMTVNGSAVPLPYPDDDPAATAQMPRADPGLAGLEAREVSAWFGEHKVLERRAPRSTRRPRVASRRRSANCVAR
jgi:hypothetical protein